MPFEVDGFEEESLAGSDDASGEEDMGIVAGIVAVEERDDIAAVCQREDY